MRLYSVEAGADPFDGGDENLNAEGYAHSHGHADVVDVIQQHIAQQAAHEGELGRRLQAAGAKVGRLTCSLMWHNHDDLDLHCETPSGEHIWWNYKKGQCGGI